MFTMIPPLSFNRRMSLWWSCVWRQFLGTLPIWLVTGAIIVGAYLAGLQGHPNFVSEVASNVYALIVYSFLVVLGVGLLSMPIIGYMARRGFAAHRLTVPAEYSFRQAVMLGLTTWGWTIVVSFVTNLAAAALRLVMGGLSDVPATGLPTTATMLVPQILALVLDLVGTLYVVIPRQAWRLRVQAGEPRA